MSRPGEMQRAATKFIVFENFEKMNTQSARQGLSEKELAWLENLQPIAPNNLAVVPAPGPVGATIAQTITSMFYASFAGGDFFFVFTSAGSGWQINANTGGTNKWAPDGTFSNPDLTVWQASRVLINDPTAGYCTFDGFIFVHQGTVSPVITVTSGGFGYTSAPNVSIVGGSGSGALAHSIVSGGQVIGIVLDQPGTGYQAGDVLTVLLGTGAGSGATASVATMSGSGVASVSLTYGGVYLSPPFIVFSGGGGSGAAATAIVSGNTVVGVTMTSQGAGYTSPPTVTFSPGAGGATATGTAVLVGQSVQSITLTAGGSAYAATPAVVFSGGGGSGAAAHTTISGGVVNTITLDAGGGGYQTAPNITITSGQGAAASAHVWPFVPGGTTLAVFQGRVWLGGGQLLQYTGTQGYDDFSAANASGSLTITDADLVHAITALRSFNNFLWIMGDQSVKQIGNISLNSLGNVTLFTILTLSSDQGTIYPRSCASFNRVFMFVNSNGVYAVFGSSVQKISDDMDGIFKLVDFSQSPQATLADINNIHNVMFLVRYLDPAGTRSILLTFTGKKWFVISQGNSLKAIATNSTLASGKLVAVGTSGTDLTPLLRDASTAVTFKLQTALTHHGNAVQRKRSTRQQWAYTASASGSLLVTIESDEAAQQFSPSIVSGFNTRMVSDPNVSGKYLGMTVAGTLAGFSLQNLALEYQEANIGNKS